MKLIYYIDVYPWTTGTPPNMPYVQDGSNLSKQAENAKRYRLEAEIPDPVVDAVVQAKIEEVA